MPLLQALPSRKQTVQALREVLPMNRENDRRAAPNALLDVPPTPDIATLEAAAESLSRHGDLLNATAVWAVILRMREELKCPVT